MAANDGREAQPGVLAALQQDHGQHHPREYSQVFQAAETAVIHGAAAHADEDRPLIRSVDQQHHDAGISGVITRRTTDAGQRPDDDHAQCGGLVSVPNRVPSYLVGHGGLLEGETRGDDRA